VERKEGLWGHCGVRTTFGKGKTLKERAGTEQGTAIARKEKKR